MQPTVLCPWTLSFWITHSVQEKFPALRVCNLGLEPKDSQEAPADGKQLHVLREWLTWQWFPIYQILTALTRLPGSGSNRSKRECCSDQVTHRKREGGLKILSGKDFKAEHIVPGNVYRLEKRKCWLSLAYSVATQHAYQKYTKRGKRKAPFWRRAGQEAKGVQLYPLQCQPTAENELHPGSTRHIHVSAPQTNQKGTNARVNQRSQRMRSIISPQFLGPYLSYTTHRCQRRQCSSREMLAMSGRWSSYRETIFRVVVGGGAFLFLYIEQVPNNQQKKQDFMDAPVDIF